MNEAITGQLLLVLIASLRIGLVLVLAPPFTYLKAPAAFRVLLALGLAAAMVGAHPHNGSSPRDALALLSAAGVDCVVGLIFVLTLQLGYAALDMAGRTLDLQAGQGFGGVIDPASRAPVPLSGVLLTRTAGLTFFASGGHLRLIELLGRSFDAAPIGAQVRLPRAEAFGAFATTMLGLGLAIAGVSLLVLFIADLTIALLVRTAPQINALILGAQVKSLLLLITLPLAFDGAGVFYQRFNMAILDGLRRLLGA